MKQLFITTLLFLSCASFAQQKILATNISSHVGDSVSVCEKVYGARYLERTGLTILNLGKEFPNQLLSVVIRGSDRDKFPYKPEDHFAGKKICVTGKVSEYGGKLQIVVTDPDQLK